MNILADLARVLTATTGTGTLTLSAAVPGFLTFAQAGVPNGAVVSYGIADDANSEAGWGVYTTAGLTLTRNVYRSTGAGNNTPIALSGTAQVFITALAEDFAASVPPASVDLDFINDLYWDAPYNPRNPFTCSRASAGYVDNLAGNWTSVAANVMRRSNKGLLLEEARTNSLRNNSMQGAVAGTPGTLPTNWPAAALAGLTQTVVGIGVENGVDYIDIRLNGTTNAIVAQLFFEGATQVAGLVGDIWLGSAFLSVVGGTQTNVTGWAFRIYDVNSSGTTLANGAVAIVPPTSTQTRFSGLRTLATAGTAFTRLALAPAVNNAAAVDITIRIGWPQLELGAHASSPIRTTNAAAVRAADVVRLTLPPPLAAAHSLYAEGTPDAPITAANDQYLAALSDGTTANRFALKRSGTIGLPAFVLNATAQAIGGTALAQSTNARLAAANASGSQIGASGGGMQRTATVATIAANAVEIGSDGLGAGQFNGRIGRVVIWPKVRLDDPAVQSISGTPPNGNGQVTRLDTGTTAGDDAVAGRIGEYTSATGTAVALTTDVPANIASLMLTAGDWDVWGNVVFTPAGTTTTTRQTAAIGIVSATLPTPPNGGAYGEVQASYGAGLGAVLSAGWTRLSLAVPTTVYLVARATFGVSTMTASAFLGARRRR